MKSIGFAFYDFERLSRNDEPGPIIGKKEFGLDHAFFKLNFHRIFVDDFGFEVFVDRAIGGCLGILILFQVMDDVIRGELDTVRITFKRVITPLRI